MKREFRTNEKRAVGWGVALLVWITSVLFLWSSHKNILGWDEIDYVNAAKLGIKANMLEQNSLSPYSYWEFARAKFDNRPANIPANYDESQDPLLLRHYHPPLVTLLLASVPSFKSERAVRSVQLLGALILCIAIICSYLIVSPSPGWFGMATVALLIFWANLSLFQTLSFHGWAAVWTTTTAASLSLWLENRKKIWGIALCCSLALSLLTLETGIFLIVIVLSYLILVKRLAKPETARGVSWAVIFIGVILIGLIVFIIWPGSVVKASMVKIPALYAYRIIRGQEYANVSNNWLYLARVLLPSFLVVAAILWVLIRERDRVEYWGPFMVIGSMYLILLVRFAISPTYLLPGIAPLICLVGIAVDKIPSKLGQSVIPVMAAALIAYSGVHWSESDRPVREDMEWLRKAMINRESLVDGSHIYQYYLGSEYVIQPISVSYDAKSLLVRERGEYRELKNDEVAGKLVIIRKRPQQKIDGPAARLLEGCSQIERNHIIVWNCGNAGPGLNGSAVNN